ncbi:zinc-binding dehydrogenase [Microlunatus soli]|uniref:Threonine dehydrogenase n=1 Tax=Microlunatus soli TaxID=630515 RepID=A0A1H1W6N8_9ACTN|nr:zinc-binding dehydrogenase [Microlunatus soli]SDS92146.1 Threonine dehydrogenase [Microlunatus soli]
MWAYRLSGPERLERIEVAEPDDPADGDVVVRFGTGGICGSDVPKFHRAELHSGRDLVGPGWPLHELTGTVALSRSPRFATGDRVVGFVRGAAGLAEYPLCDAAQLVPVPADVAAERAVVIQPLATVLYAVDRLGDVAGKRAAVLGLGSIGLLFAAVLSARGAQVTGVDPIDRVAVAEQFGIGELATTTAEAWATGLPPAQRFDVCVEAVGHQTATLPAAFEAVAPGGQVYAFGVPDHDHYELPFRGFFGKAATLLTGVTGEWAPSLAAAARYLAERPALADGYITHRFGIDAAQTAYETASRSEPGRLKVVIDAP